MADGCEEIEALTVVDIARRAGIEVAMISITGEKIVKGAHGIHFETDIPAEFMDFELLDGIVLPGGMPGTLNLGANKYVLQTIIDLKEAGFIPVLVADCVTSRKETDKMYAIERARQEGAIVTTYESLLFELLKEAGTDTSKKIQKIIK